MHHWGFVGKFFVGRGVRAATLRDILSQSVLVCYRSAALAYLGTPLQMNRL
jgi:hypothetical protein